MLSVIKINGKTKQGNTTFLCQCDCGKMKTVSGGNLRDKFHSCGCYNWNRTSPSRPEKICSKCKTTKNIECFSVNKSRTDGRSQYCKKCKVKMDRKYQGKYQSHKAEYTRNKRRSDISFRIASNLRRRINGAIKNNTKSCHTLALIGCTVEELKTYLASKFQPGMSWSNYGLRGWHIDHKVPCDTFDLSIGDNQKKCFHYTNLQPLWAFDNISKGNKIL